MVPQAAAARGVNPARLLEGKTAIVTGGAQGIGRACALAFAQHGAGVALADIDLDGCERAAREIAAETGATTLAHHCDVGDDEQCEGLIAAAADHFGGLDILLSNAGILAPGDVLTVSREKFDRVHRVNLRAGFVLGQLAAREMVRRKSRGSILFMSSVNERLAIPNQLAYVVSKGGLSQLTRVMSVGLAAHGIRVNAIGPGSIETDILKSVMSDESARLMILSRTPMGRLGQPEEIASVAVFLASEMASYITGQTLFADGGRLPLNYTVPV